MFKYSILKVNKDFVFWTSISNVKGSRKKRITIDKFGYKIGFFKYEKYNCSEACSEKLSCEIAKKLRIPCANIEFARDEEGILGCISYLFVTKIDSHIDAKDLIDSSEFDRKKFCTISNIKSFLDGFGLEEFEKFIEMMVFDALIGETDRHEENWGLTKKGKEYKFSPLYDCSCNLLREFKNKEFAELFYSGKKKLEDYIKKSPTCIYKENFNGKYKHFELVEKLIKDYPEITSKKIKKLRKLTNFWVWIILARLPKEIIDYNHKKYIYKYIIMRRNFLLNMIKKGEK